VGWYAQVIFPRLYDLMLGMSFVARLRQRLLDSAAGDILEIGFGTGLNLPHYPAHVRRITVVDPSPGMHRLAQKRIDTTGIQVDHRLLGSERLPFADNRFDCVISTFTLCSIANVDQALGEVYRTLKPGGRFLLLEHGLSPESGVQRWQRRLSWLQMRLADGCRLDRDIQGLVAAQPFGSVQMDKFYSENMPRTHGYLYMGAATK
jgi:ubiquinone/menaquinone biosynthesis C-methylase UbiE